MAGPLVSRRRRPAAVVLAALLALLALLGRPVAASAAPAGACQPGQIGGPAPATSATTLDVVAEAYNCLLDDYGGAAAESPALLLRGAFSAAAAAAGAPGVRLAPLPGERAAAWAAFATALSPLLAAAPGEGARTLIDQAAIRGMAASLGDDHTGYLTPATYARELRQLGGQSTVSLGLRFEGDPARQQVFVVEVVAGGPADGLDVQAGDVLEAINGRTVASIFSATQAPAGELATLLSRGSGLSAGQAVRLDLYRPRTDTRRRVTLVAAPLALPDVEGGMLPDGVGYVHVWTFSTSSAAQVTGLLGSEVGAGARRIVLDLRDDPGGSLGDARAIASLFTHRAPLGLVQSKGQSYAVNPLPDVRLLNLPADVIIDGGSAYASEFVAAALQDAGAATVVGSRSAGAIGAAGFYGLDDGSGLEITIAQTLRSTGAPLDGVGVQPDLAGPPSAAALSNGHDLALEAALSGHATGELVTTFPVGTWVVTVVPGAELWSGPDNRAIAFGAQPLGSRYLVVAPPQGGRLFVYDPRTNNYAWIDASAVRPQS